MAERHIYSHFRLQVTYVCMLAVLVIILLVLPSTTTAQDNGHRLPNSAQYFLAAGKKVRPKQNYQVWVTIFRMPYEQLDVRALLTRNGEEYASAVVPFYGPGTKEIELQVPLRVDPGLHMLTVEGLLNASSTQAGFAVFRNESEIEFQPKYVSIFIQTDKPLYYPPSEVNFRIIGIKQDYKPLSGSMTIYVRDSKGIIVWRFLTRQLNMGIYTSKFELTYPVNIGEWSILVDGFGTRYERNFTVVFWYERRYEVNLTIPFHTFDTDWGVTGIIHGEHSSNRPSVGNATIKLWVRNPDDGSFEDGDLEVYIPYMIDRHSWSFRMQDINEKWGDVVGKELYVKGWIYDWYWNETQNGTAFSKVYKDGVNVKLLGRRIRAFKPGSPFTVYFAVVRADNTLYEGALDRVVFVQRNHEGDSTITHPEEHFLTPDDGIVRYTVTPNEDDQRILIRAWHPTGGAQTEIEVYRHHNENNRYISITSSTEEPMVNHYMVFTVRVNFYVDEILYLLMSGGSIMTASSLTMKVRQKTFAIALSRIMAPRARMIAYCMIDGEVITDAITFFVRDTLLVSSSLELNQGKDFKRDTLEIIARGPPGAFVAINGLDYDFYNRGATAFYTFISEEWVINEMLSYDEGDESPYQHIWWYDSPAWDGSVFFPAHTAGLDVLTTFELSGLVALSDLNLTVPEELHPCNKTLGLARCLNGQCYDAYRKCDRIRDCMDGTDEISCPVEEKYLPIRRPPFIQNMHLCSQNFDPNLWLWKTSFLKPNGQVEMSFDVPILDDNFAISAFVLHPEQGLSIIEEPIQYDVTHVFYMLVEAPGNSKRGEQIGIRLAIFNEWEEALEVVVTLHEGEGYRFIAVNEFGFANSYNPTTLAGDIQTMVQLPAGENVYVMMPVQPLIEYGEITVVVSAVSILRSDVEELEIEIVIDGANNDDHIPYLVDLVNKGSLVIPDFEIPFPERFLHPDSREHIYIPGSNAAYQYIHGDMAVPGFFEDHMSADATTGLPHDSAEGYMSDFAYNLRTLEFLQAVDHLTEENTVNAMEYMKSILMRQYAYMQDDGSYKMFRRTQKPCLWLTAFVLKYLHGAMVSEWNEELYIESWVVNKIARWIALQQDSETGAFPEISDHYYDRNLWPTTVDHDGVEYEWHLCVTAYVTIALAEATRVYGEARVLVDHALLRSGSYMASKLLHITDPYHMAIVAYALHMVNHNQADTAYALLKTMARKGETMYWAALEIEPNEIKWVDTIPRMQIRGDYINEGNGVTATSYALMLYLRHNELKMAEPIMKWLKTQQYGVVCWASNPDTLIAMQALTEYAKRETNRDLYNIHISMISTAQDDWKHDVYLNYSNFAELFEFEMENAWGHIRATAQGTGYAFMHLTVEYNADKQSMMDTPDFDAHETVITDWKCRGFNCSIVDVRICTRWLRPDVAPESGMANFVIEIPTGYVVSRDIIDRMYLANYPGVQRIRFRDSALIIFFEYVTQEYQCLNYTMERWYPVSNMSIAHLINNFEYTEPGLQRNINYNTYDLFHNHICQVCGSFQCPYCPFYNRATSVRPSVIVAVLLALTVLLLVRQQDRL